RQPHPRRPEARAYARYASGGGADRAADRRGAVQRAPPVGRAAQEDPGKEPVAARSAGARRALVTLDERKRALRREMRALREKLAPDDARARSAGACARLLAHADLAAE